MKSVKKVLRLFKKNRKRGCTVSAINKEIEKKKKKKKRVPGSAQTSSFRGGQ